MAAFYLQKLDLSLDCYVEGLDDATRAKVEEIVRLVEALPASPALRVSSGRVERRVPESQAGFLAPDVADRLRVEVKERVPPPPPPRYAERSAEITIVEGLVSGKWTHRREVYLDATIQPGRLDAAIKRLFADKKITARQARNPITKKPDIQLKLLVDAEELLAELKAAD